MSSSKTPPEQFQRWVPAALELPKSVAMNAAAQLTTAAALEEIHQQARQEGYQAGLAEGLEASRRQGAAQVAEEIRRLQDLLDPLAQAVRECEQAMIDDMLALSLEISRQMLRQALRVKPDLLLQIVRGAMESLPQNTPHPHVHLHPEDAALVRARMQAEASHGGWRIVEDPQLQRGGCRIETPVSEIDATIDNRWQRLAAALGQDARWLDE